MNIMIQECLSKITVNVSHNDAGTIYTYMHNNVKHLNYKTTLCNKNTVGAAM